MPFTPTHIVAILALAWRRFPRSALTTGFVIPDVPLFFPVVDYSRSHSMSDIPFICLPLRMTSFIAFQLGVREPVLSILPVWIQRLATNIARPLMEPCVTFFVFVSLAIMISACLHLIWNVFSHQGQWGT